jgi:hypothetical protein
VSCTCSAFSTVQYGAGEQFQWKYSAAGSIAKDVTVNTHSAEQGVGCRYIDTAHRERPSGEKIEREERVGRTCHYSVASQFVDIVPNATELNSTQGFPHLTQRNAMIRKCN